MVSILSNPKLCPRTLTDHVQQLISLMSSKSIKVKVGPYACISANHTVSLPPMPADATEKDFVRYFHLGTHEQAHIYGESDFTRIAKNKILAKLENALEDIRCEQLQEVEYPGLISYRIRFYQDALVDFVNPELSAASYCDIINLIHALGKYIITKVRAIQLDAPTLVVTPSADLSKAYYTHVSDLELKIVNMKTSDEMYTLSSIIFDRFKDLLREEMEKRAKEQQKNQQKQKQEAKNDNEESDSQEGGEESGDESDQSESGKAGKGKRPEKDDDDGEDSDQEDSSDSTDPDTDSDADDGKDNEDGSSEGEAGEDSGDDEATEEDDPSGSSDDTEDDDSGPEQQGDGDSDEDSHSKDEVDGDSDNDRTSDVVDPSDSDSDDSDNRDSDADDSLPEDDEPTARQSDRGSKIDPKEIERIVEQLIEELCESEDALDVMTDIKEKVNSVDTSSLPYMVDPSVVEYVHFGKEATEMEGALIRNEGLKMLGPKGAQLTQLFISQTKPRTLYNRTSGNLDVVAFANDHLDNRDDLFSDKLGAKLDKAAVTFMIDNSSSMRGTIAKVYSILSGTLSILSKACIPTEAVGYTVDSNHSDLWRDVPAHLTIIKDFRETYSGKVLRRCIAPTYMGNTNDLDCLRFCVPRLWARPEKKKVIIVLCDGEPTMSTPGLQDRLQQSYKEYIQICRKAGITVFGIGLEVQPDKLENYFGNDCVSVSSSNVGDAILSKLTKILNK